MEETEKMVALKKAYAVIILNTAKEAAGRVMAAERKAVRFQHDLRSTKDEALRMLLRFKQMIDAKTTEAKITSLSQQRKIEELDAQLNEAEGIILDLRTELRKAQDELEEVKNNQMRHTEQVLKKEKVPYFENMTHDMAIDISQPFTPSPQFSKCFNPANQTATSCSHFDNFFVDNPNLASIIMKSKEPELYRNGCTQRVRAMERNFLDGNLPSENLADQHCLGKDEEVIIVNEQNEGAYTVLSTKAENADIKNQVGSDVQPISSGADKDQPLKLRELTRRRTRYGKSKAFSSRFRRCQSNKPQHSSLAFPNCKRSIHTDNNVKSGVGISTQPVTKPGNNTEQEYKLADNNEQGLCILRRSRRKRKVRCWDDVTTSTKSIPSQFIETGQPSLVLSRCKTYWGNYGVRSKENRLKSKYEAEIRKDKGPASRNVIIDTEPDKVVEDTDLVDVSISVTHEGEATENPGFSSWKIHNEADNVLSADSKATNGSAGQTDRNRLLKYTFSRKKKKGLLYKSDECSSLGNNSINSNTGENVNISPELLESSLMTESSRDSQSLVQVACQEIDVATVYVRSAQVHPGGS